MGVMGKSLATKALQTQGFTPSPRALGASSTE